MKQFYKILALVALLATAAACDTPIPDVPSQPLSDKVVKINAVPAGDFTKATDTAFEQGDEVSIFGYKGDGNGSVSAWLPWLVNGKFTKTENGFTPDQTYYWYAGEESGVIIGLYPYNANYTAEALLGGVDFCVKADQSTHAGYTASDLMTAFKPDVTPTEEQVVLEFDHLLSKLIIDIDNQSSANIKEVYIDGVKGNIEYSLSGGVSLTGSEGTIKAGKLARASEGYTDTYVLIIPPQQAAPSIAITTTNQKQYTYKASDDIDFGMGKVRHLMTTITEESISTDFDAIVNDWSADENVEFSQQGSQPGGGDEPLLKITPIADILALGTNATIGSAVVEGVVISNAALNNLTSKKGLYIQDSSAGLQFYLSANHDLAFGDQVQIDLSGATIGEYNGAIQISNIGLDKISKLSSGNVVEPKLVNLKDFLDNKYESQYVAIAGVQVAEADLSKTWVMDGVHTSITMEDAQGNNFVVFSSEYATYGAQTVAQGSGMIKGIAGYNKGNVQIIFAQESDYADLTNARLGSNAPVVEGMTVNPLWFVELIPEFYDEESATTYQDVIRVLSTDEENGFFVEFFDETYYNESIKPNISEYVEKRAAGLRENLNNYNAENGVDFNFLDYKNYYFGAYDGMFLLNPGKCIVAMWGMTVEGEVTGLYYISDTMEIRDPATPEYKAWIGTYLLKDSNDLTSEITISQNVVNESFWLDGWNGIYGNAIALPFNPTGGTYGNGSVVIQSQVLASDFYLGDTLIDKLTFGGLLTTENGAMYLGEDYQLAMMEWWSEEPGYMAVINPYIYNLPSGGSATVSNAGYFLEFSEGVSIGTEDIHSFPAYITDINYIEPEPASMVARKRNIFEEGNNGIAKPLSEVRYANTRVGNYVVGGRTFNAINF